MIGGQPQGIQSSWEKVGVGKHRGGQRQREIWGIFIYNAYVPYEVKHSMLKLESNKNRASVLKHWRKLQDFIFATPSPPFTPDSPPILIIFLPRSPSLFHKDA